MEKISELLSMVVPVGGFFGILPESAGVHSEHFGEVFAFMTVTCILLTILVVFFTILFTIKYRKKRFSQVAMSQKSENRFLEFFWILTVSTYVLGVFIWGFYGFLDLRTPPADSKELRVIGQKWQWTVQYPEEEISVSGQGAIIGVKLNNPVKLIMSSQDVIHSFGIPNFSVKQDVVPGRYTSLWFKPIKEGEFPVFCTEYCGEQHSMMLAKIKVMNESDYDNWVENVKMETQGYSPLELGKRLYEKKGCIACHSIDGTSKIGPTFKALYGKTEELEGGGEVLVNDDYIKQSILDPQKQITKGYPPVMPSFRGQLSENEIIALIEFIKSLK